MRHHSFEANTNIAVDTSLGAIDLLKPVIVTPLPVKKIEKVGKTLRLLCLITGYPPLKIQWYLNNELLQPTDSNLKSCSKVSFESNERELVIKNLTSKDSGIITFVAENKYGVAKSSCQLIIIGKKSSTSKDLPSSPICKKVCRALTFKNTTK